jgi:aminoglycoside phosphotransferase (APT) family kinase protein
VDAELPDDPMGRADMSKRVPRTLAALNEVEPLWAAPPWVFEALEAAHGFERPASTVVVHGDLHLRHVLIDRGALAGVIDWGDVCRGDPSMDLALCWCVLPPDGRADFFAEYGRVTTEQILIARVLAWFLCAVLAVYGANEGLETLTSEALAGLRRAT